MRSPCNPTTSSGFITRINFGLMQVARGMGGGGEISAPAVGGCFITRINFGLMQVGVFDAGGACSNRQGGGVAVSLPVLTSG